MVLICLIGLGLLLFIEQFTDSSKLSRNSADSHPKSFEEPKVNYDERANYHLFWQNKKMELQQDTVKFENDRAKMKVGDSIISEADRKSLFSDGPPQKGVDFDLDTYEQQSLQDLKRDRPEIRAYSPGNIIQGEISDKLNDKEFRQRWIKTFIAKYEAEAKANGWIIKVRPDLTIETLRPADSQNDAEHKMRNGER